MPWFLKQSTASQEVLLGPFVSDTDGKTAQTALSIANTDIKVFKTGATSEASKNNGGATHISAGRYYCVLDATDTDTIGLLRLSVQVTGALPVWLDCCVLDEAVYDWMFGTVAPLTPTVAGRTLDVSATGEAGIDWANVGSPTTAVDLSGTTIATTQKVDVDTIKTQAVTCAAGVTVGAFVGNATAALAVDVNGRVDVSRWAGETVLLGGNGPGDQHPIVAVDFIRDFSTGDWKQPKFSPVNGNVIVCIAEMYDNVGEYWPSKVTDPGYLQVEIRSSSVDSIAAGAIAANAITASAIATDAVTEIQSGLATASALATVASYIDTEVAAIKAKTDLLPASPAATSDIPSAASVAAAVLAAGDVDGFTLEQTLKLCLSALAGKLSGAATTTITIRATDDSKNRITATVDADGNRSAVTLDAAG